MMRKWIFLYYFLFFFTNGYSYPKVFSFGATFLFSGASLNLLGRSGTINEIGEILELSDKNIVEIKAGKTYSLARSETGIIYSWGSNAASYELLGRSTGAKGTPLPINSTFISGQIIQMAASDECSLLLDDNGIVYTFGDKFLGRSENFGLGVAQQIENTESLTFISIFSKGDVHLLLASTGDVYTFGSNSSFLSLGHSGSGEFPEQLAIGESVQKICSGIFQSALLSASNKVYTFGANNSIDLARTTDPTIPDLIQNTQNLAGVTFSNIFCGLATFLLATDGRVFSWGSDVPVRGHLQPASIPSQVTTVIQNRKIVAGDTGWIQTFLIDETGIVFSLGTSDGYPTSRPEGCGLNLPYPIQVGHFFTQVSTNQVHTLLLANGSREIPPNFECVLETTNPPTTNLPTTNTPEQRNNKKDNTGLIVGLVLTGIILLLVAGFAFLFFFKRKHTGSTIIQLEEQNIFPGINRIPKEQLQIGELIGVGNYGSVYKCTWNGSVVAAKKLKDPQHAEEFAQETKILSKLSNNLNIIRFLGLFRDADGNNYIITEYAIHGSLVSFLQTHPGLPVSDLIIMSSQIAAGMMALESVGIIHRDLSARNILVGEENGSYIAKISDFGLSRNIHKEIYSSKQREFPVKWTAPEALEYRIYTSKSDVWSYGIVLWEIFSRGMHPYPDFSNHEVRRELLNGYRLPKPGECPPSIYEIMQLCWAIKPEHRPTFTQLFKKMSEISEPYKKTKQKEENDEIKEKEEVDIYNNA